MLMLNVVFRTFTYQYKRSVWQGTWTTGLGSLWTLEDMCAMTHMEARDNVQKSGFSVYHGLRRLYSGCQACSVSTLTH